LVRSRRFAHAGRETHAARRGSGLLHGGRQARLHGGLPLEAGLLLQLPMPALSLPARRTARAGPRHGVADQGTEQRRRITSCSRAVRFALPLAFAFAFAVVFAFAFAVAFAFAFTFAFAVAFRCRARVCPARFRLWASDEGPRSARRVRMYALARAGAHPCARH